MSDLWEELVFKLNKRIFQLEAENKRLREEHGKAIGLAASLAETSDRMKLQLILAGRLK
jgi:hypothetical protein